MADFGLHWSMDPTEFVVFNDSGVPHQLDTHLQNHAPPLDRNRITLIIAYCTLFTLGTAGNAWVTFVVGRVFLQSRTEAPRAVQIFILSLCACELSMLAFLLFLICDLVFGRWIVPSRLVCRLYLSSEGMNKFCSPFLLASLSGFCYIRLHGTPTSAHSTASTRKAVYLVIFCVLFSLTLMTPVYEYGDLHYLIEYNETHILNVMTKCAFHPPKRVMVAFTTYGFLAGYLTPAALFTFFYVAALTSARNQRKRSSCQQPQPMDQLDRSNSKSERSNDASIGSPYLRRVRTTTFGLIFVYLACWTPYWLMSLYHCSTPHDQDGFESQAAVMVSYFLHMLPYINCVIYPLVYTLLNSHLKKDYKKAKDSQKRRRLAHRKPRQRFPMINLQMKQKFSCQSIATTATNTAGTTRSSFDVLNHSSVATVSKSTEDPGSPFRRRSSCQLFAAVEDRYFFARSSLRRNVKPALACVNTDV